MMTKSSLMLLGAAASLALLVGCKKSDDSSSASTAAPAAATGAAAAPGAAPAAGDIGTCPTQEVPMGGTVKLLRAFTVKQAPDPMSPRLTNLGPGTFVDLKASCGNWMKIMYPVGVGQLGPGWVELREIQNPTAAQTTTPPPPPAPTPTPTTTTPPPTPSASAKAPPTKPGIVVPPRKK
jgi:hypothetical protein